MWVYIKKNVRPHYISMLTRAQNSQRTAARGTRHSCHAWQSSRAPAKVAGSCGVDV